MLSSIANHLFSYHAAEIYPFHMPGHKRNARFLCEGLLGDDITEIPEMDNLHQPERGGIIADAQARAARLFGADKSFFLVNGSTGGLTAAMLSALCDGGRALVARNCHRSVYTGLALTGAHPVYIQPENTPFGFPGGVSPERVKRALENDGGITAVILTSPTYEGVVSDIAAIARIAHEKNALLIVDEAHGAHFAFSPYFPKSAVALGADIVVQSLHKTLPALTQTAILHTAGGRADLSRLKAALAMTQTSSPSYMMLAQADHCLSMLSENPEIIEMYIRLLSDFRAAAGQIGGALRLAERGCGYEYDRGKLVFYIQSEEMDGKQIEAVLRDVYRVQIELSGARHFIAMTSPADTPEGFARLLRGVSKLSAELKPSAQRAIRPALPALPRMIYTPRKVVFGRMPKAVVPVGESIGRCAADFVIPYPPGIPLIVPGEEISENAAAQIIDCIQNKIPLHGQDALQSGRISVCL